VNLYLQRALIGAVINLILALGAYRKRAVTPSGGITGLLLGTCIYLAGGLFFWVHLGAFFFSSTLLGRIRTRTKSEAAEIHAKDGRRDGIQVLSNIGPATTAAIIYLAYPHPAWAVAYAASFAAANADTWAGEIGMLASREPSSILTGKSLNPGTSGAVTALGFGASFLGSLLIGVIFGIGYVLYEGFTVPALFRTAVVVVCGFLGSVLDSFLGAVIQAGYRCAVTGGFTEKPVTQGRPNILIKGVACITNDTVNLISVTAITLLAAFTSLAI